MPRNAAQRVTSSHHFPDEKVGYHAASCFALISSPFNVVTPQAYVSAIEGGSERWCGRPRKADQVDSSAKDGYPSLVPMSTCMAVCLPLLSACFLPHRSSCLEFFSSLPYSLSLFLLPSELGRVKASRVASVAPMYKALAARCGRRHLHVFGPVHSLLVHLSSTCCRGRCPRKSVSQLSSRSPVGEAILHGLTAFGPMPCSCTFVSLVLTVVYVVMLRLSLTLGVHILLEVLPLAVKVLVTNGVFTPRSEGLDCL